MKATDFYRLIVEGYLEDNPMEPKHLTSHCYYWATQWLQEYYFTKEERAIRYQEISEGKLTPFKEWVPSYVPLNDQQEHFNPKTKDFYKVVNWLIPFLNEAGIDYPSKEFLNEIVASSIVAYCERSLNKNQMLLNAMTAPAFWKQFEQSLKEYETNIEPPSFPIPVEFDKHLSLEHPLIQSFIKNPTARNLPFSVRHKIITKELNYPDIRKEIIANEKHLHLMAIIKIKDVKDK